MLATVSGPSFDFEFADGTIAGGVALTNLRFNVQRIFDVIVPLGELDPVLYDRGVRRTSVDFEVSRVHASLEASDLYIIEHDAAIPDSGTVMFTATNGAVRYLLHAELITHERIGIRGKATAHAYHIEGGRILAVPAFYILTEISDYVLQETGDLIELQH